MSYSFPDVFLAPLFRDKSKSDENFFTNIINQVYSFFIVGENVIDLFKDFFVLWVILRSC